MNLQLLSELKQGATKINDFWVKHPTIEDEAQLEVFNLKFLALAQKRKIPLEAESIINANKNGLWTESNERDLNSSLAYLSRLRKSYDKIIEPLKKDLEADLNSIYLKVINLKERKAAAIGKTAEDWASKISNERYVLGLFFKDKDFTERAWEEEDAEFLESDDINSIFKDFNNYRDKVNDDPLKSLACSHFCQNLYCISGNSFSFFGKSIINMTCLQQRFCLFMENYKNIISSISGKVPDNIICDWKELDKWSKSSESGREDLEKDWSGFNKGGAKINYENIKKASLVEGDGKTKAIQDLLA